MTCEAYLGTFLNVADTCSEQNLLNIYISLQPKFEIQAKKGTWFTIIFSLTHSSIHTLVTQDARAIYSYAYTYTL